MTTSNVAADILKILKATPPEQYMLPLPGGLISTFGDSNVVFLMNLVTAQMVNRCLSKMDAAFWAEAAKQLDSDQVNDQAGVIIELATALAEFWTHTSRPDYDTLVSGDFFMQSTLQGVHIVRFAPGRDLLTYINEHEDSRCADLASRLHTALEYTPALNMGTAMGLVGGILDAAGGQAIVEGISGDTVIARVIDGWLKNNPNDHMVRNLLMGLQTQLPETAAVVAGVHEEMMARSQEANAVDADDEYPAAND